VKRSTLSTSRETVVPLAPILESDTDSTQRLIVLIPSSNVDDNDLMYRVCDLALPTHSQVLLLSLCSYPNEELRTRRQLVNMAGILQNNQISTKIQVEVGHDWVDALRVICHPGDLIVCHTEQQVEAGRGPLRQIQSSDLRTPLYIIPDLGWPGDAKTGLFARVAAWVGSIGILLAFFWIQVMIEKLARDWMQTILIYGSIVIEIACIWMWNSLIG
jgi:hypothetical protein